MNYPAETGSGARIYVRGWFRLSSLIGWEFTVL
jgi:hypothetical protein